MPRSLTLPLAIRISYARTAVLFILLALGLLTVYVVGLHQNPAVHEAFHDIRHAAGFPCH